MALSCQGRPYSSILIRDGQRFRNVKCSYFSPDQTTRGWTRGQGERQVQAAKKHPISFPSRPGSLDPWRKPTRRSQGQLKAACPNVSVPPSAWKPSRIRKQADPQAARQSPRNQHHLHSLAPQNRAQRPLLLCWHASTAAFKQKHNLFLHENNSLKSTTVVAKRTRITGTQTWAEQLSG